MFIPMWIFIWIGWFCVGWFIELTGDVNSGHPKGISIIVIPLGSLICMCIYYTWFYVRV